MYQCTSRGASNKTNTASRGEVEVVLAAAIVVVVVVYSSSSSSSCSSSNSSCCRLATKQTQEVVVR